MDYGMYQNVFYELPQSDESRWLVEDPGDLTTGS